MTHAPFRPLASKDRSRARAGSVSATTSRATGGVASARQAPFEQLRKPRGPTALAGNIDAFVAKPRSKATVFVSKHARIKTRIWLYSASATLEQIIDKAVEAKLAERLNAPSKAVAAARERGAAWKRTEYVSPDNLSLEQASGYVGLSTRVINERRNDGRYYALLAEGQTRGFRFPRWQFDVQEQRLQPVLDIAWSAGASAWGIHVFMISPSSLLDGAAPRDWVGDAGRDLERVLGLAHKRFHGDQGAG